jgi:hypothetical protein
VEEAEETCWGGGVEAAGGLLLAEEALALFPESPTERELFPELPTDFELLPEFPTEFPEFPAFPESPESPAFPAAPATVLIMLATRPAPPPIFPRMPVITPSAIVNSTPFTSLKHPVKKELNQ